jgi:capsular exopolysaccharide synthesis family protein
MDNNAIENQSPNLALLQTDVPSQENLLQIVLHNRWTIASVTLLAMAIAFVYLLKATPIYTSASRLYVEQTGPKIISEYEGVMTKSNNYLYTQGELIRSSPIITDVAGDPQIKPLKTFANVDNLTGFIKKKLKVTIGKRDDIIAVLFDSPYPAEAAQIVNAVVDSYVRYHSSRKRSTASEVLRILHKDKIERDKELSAKFTEMLDFTRKNGVVSFDNNKGGNIVLERLSRLSTVLTESQIGVLNAKADYEAIKSMADEPVKIKQFAAASASVGVQVFVGDRETQLQSELRQTDIELKNAKFHCTEDHPSVQAIYTKINRIKQELNDQAREFADAYTEVMRLRWLAAKEREDEMRLSFDTQRQEAQELGVKAAEYTVLQSELNRAERICDILDDRIKELNVTEDVGALNISVLEVARPADSPSKPQKAKVMSVALFLGVMLGSGIALLSHSLDFRLRSAEEISAVLGMPVLGVVPTMSQGRRSIVNQGQKAWFRLKSVVGKAYRRIRSTVVSIILQSEVNAEEPSILARAKAYRAMRSDTYNGVATDKAKSIPASLSVHIADTKPAHQRDAVVFRGQKVFLESKSIAAEAYRTIRTAVFFGAPKGEAKTILVTSPAPGDGKSTLVSNLAIAMAQAGQKTLILDGDFRRPVLHKIFEIDDKIGVSSVLAGNHILDAAIQPGPVEGLDILCCGPEVPNPSELLNSDTFAATLKELSNRYERIIIDSPPVGPVADSQILAALCDICLLVLRAEKSTKRQGRQARDSLLSVGAHILGAVVNDVSRKHGRYGYYSKYGYYSSYGYYAPYGHYGYYGKREKKTG